MPDKLPATKSLQFIQERLLPELSLIRLDKPTRTKGQAFAIEVPDGKHFLLILGDNGEAKQTRIITEKVSTLPSIPGVKFSDEAARSSRVNQQTTSLGIDNHLKNNNQSSFYVSNLDALAELIRWYAGKASKTTDNTDSKPESRGKELSPDYSLPSDSRQTLDIIDIIGQRYDTPTTREQLIEARLGQGKFKQNVIRTWGLGKRCAVTGIDIPQLLIASHIIPWHESEELRLDGKNGILLCSHIDKLFDQHLISFDDIGQLVPSKRLSKSNWQHLETIGVHQSLRLNTSALEDVDKNLIKENLKRHHQRLIDLDSFGVSRMKHSRLVGDDKQNA